MAKTITLRAEKMEVPQGPRFVRRVEDDCPVPLGELTDKQIERLGRAMTKAMITRAKDQRAKGVECFDFPGPRASFNRREYGE